MVGIKKAAEYVRAELGPRVPDAEAKVRLAVCQSCDHVSKTPKGLFCTGCGCPQWRRSELTTKTKMARVDCPLGRWKQPSVAEEDRIVAHIERPDGKIVGVSHKRYVEIFGAMPEQENSNG